MTDATMTEARRGLRALHLEVPAVIAEDVSRLVEAAFTALEADRDQLARWKAEALPVLEGLWDLGAVLGVPLGERITGDVAAERARALAAERDEAHDRLDSLLTAVERECRHMLAVPADLRADREGIATDLRAAVAAAQGDS